MDTTEQTGAAVFQGISPRELDEMLSCMKVREREFDKGSRIFQAGDRVTELGLVRRGGVLIQNDDAWGHTTILARVGPGELFAETYACSGEPLLVDAVAAEPTRVLFLQVSQLLHTCPNSCACHSRLIGNLLMVLAQKNLVLSKKISHTSAKSIRGRLLAYLSDQAKVNRSPSFTIPFDRQQLADYLNVERSALSNELSKMCREGLIRTDRSRFQLLSHEEAAGQGDRRA